MGGYATNGSHQEVDLGVSYTKNWLTVAVNDYYYPTAVGEQDRYFEFAKGKTGHSVEAAVTVAPSPSSRARSDNAPAQTPSP